MTTELVVLMGDAVAGSLTRASGGVLRFTYDELYRTGRSATPLSVSMPLEVASHGDAVVSPWLWGLLPDNDAVLRRWAVDFHVSAASPFSLLSTPVGEDCAGAVRFAAPDRVEAALGRGGAVEWLDESGVATRLRDLHRDSTAWLGNSFIGRFSLAGAQAKTALLRDGDRWGVPSGASATSHLLKPAALGLDDHDLNEHLCLRAARLAGLPSATSAVITFEDQDAIVIERYDRRRRLDGTLQRIHQEDFCQALGRHPSQKYQNEGGPTSAEVVRLLHEVMPPDVAARSVRRFADALVWNWLTAGTDAHAKNYSLLLSGQQVRFAPLYDLASALPYAHAVQKLRMAMKLGGSYLLTARDATMWPKAAAELGLDADELAARARGLTERVPDAIAQAAQEEATRRMRSALPARLVDAVAARASACAATLP